MQSWHSMYRTSNKFYTSRPPASCRAARIAWDRHAEKGPIKRLRLLDGYWGAERENGHWDEIENCFDKIPQVVSPGQASQP